MKKVFKGLFEPFYYLYQRRLSDQIINFLKRYPAFQYIFSLLITLGIMYLVLVVYR